MDKARAQTAAHLRFTPKTDATIGGVTPPLAEAKSNRAAATVDNGLGAPACAERRRGRRRSAAAARAARPAAACASTRAPRPRVLPGRATRVTAGRAGLQGGRTGSCRPCSAWVTLKLALFARIQVLAVYQQAPTISATTFHSHLRSILNVGCTTESCRTGACRSTAATPPPG